MFAIYYLSQIRHSPVVSELTYNVSSGTLNSTIPYRHSPESAEWVVVREELCSLESCCLSLIKRNSVLEELRVRRFAVIQEHCDCTLFTVL